MSKYKNLTPDELLRVAEIESSTDLERALLAAFEQWKVENYEEANEHFEDHYSNILSTIRNSLIGALGEHVDEHFEKPSDVVTTEELIELAAKIRIKHDELEAKLNGVHL